ncbi:DUF2971 domain-containing protein [Psychrobacter sp. HD31]|uniref:DUF2971 domain-containing protein n=1 Tax=Psychrobacter sp. HD31 TaxID=3112003 RepID=UPI003DA5707B
MRIFKYRTFNDNNLKSLKENYIWLADKASLNDPCEGFFTRKKLSNDLQGLNFISKLIQGSAQFNTLEENLDDVIAMVAKQGIFSASKSPFIQPLWSLYANSHQGFCIEYDIDELIAKHKTYYNYFEVQYLIQPQDISFSNLNLNFKDETSENKLFQKIIGTKHIDWQNEQEVRVISHQVGQNFHRHGAIKAIYFGLKSSLSDRNNILKLLANRDIKFNQIVQDTNSYNLFAKPMENPFLNNEKENIIPLSLIDECAIYEKGVKDKYRKFIPFLYKAQDIMSKDPDCEVIHTIDFSIKSTLENPIIYVNFKEKNCDFYSSQKLFTINELQKN